MQYMEACSLIVHLGLNVVERFLRLAKDVHCALAGSHEVILISLVDQVLVKSIKF